MGRMDSGNVSSTANTNGRVNKYRGVIPVEIIAGVDKADELIPAKPIGVLLDDVEPEQVEWLWERRIPLGKLTVADGDPGIGKSVMTLDLAGRISAGIPLPGSTAARTGGVVLLSAEDGLGDTIRPRLEAVGANLTRIVALTGIPDKEGERLPAIPHDIPYIEQAIDRVDAIFVIIDPLMAFLGNGIDTRHDHDVRRALAPLASMAERKRVSVVVVRHLNKATGGSPLYRGGGSIGIIGAARSGLLIAVDPDDPDQRVLVSLKSNLGPSPPALLYRLQGTPNGAVRVEWLGESRHSASDLLAIRAPNQKRSKMDEARDFLRTILGSGPLKSNEVERLAEEAGIAGATLEGTVK